MVKFCGPYKTEFVLWTSGWLYATEVFDRSSLQLKEVHLPNMYKNDVVILVLGIHKLHHGQMEQIGLANEETYGVYVYI